MQNASLELRRVSAERKAEMWQVQIMGLELSAVPGREKTEMAAGTELGSSAQYDFGRK